MYGSNPDCSYNNAHYVEASLAIRKGLFEGFESGVPGSGFINIGGKETIPIHIRNSKWYQDQSLPHYEMVKLISPSYSGEYLHQFPDELLTVPKIRILLWRRT